MSYKEEGGDMSEREIVEDELIAGGATHGEKEGKLEGDRQSERYDTLNTDLAAKKKEEVGHALKGFGLMAGGALAEAIPVAGQVVGGAAIIAGGVEFIQAGIAKGDAADLQAEAYTAERMRDEAYSLDGRTVNLTPEQIETARKEAEAEGVHIVRPEVTKE